MKKFNEWKTEVNEHLDPEVLISKLNDLAESLYFELKSFQGERFKGWSNIVGEINNLRRTLSAVENDAIVEDCGEPHKPRKMEKAKHSEVVSKGVRKGEKDLSSDYKGHIKTNGDIEPFKKI